MTDRPASRGGFRWECPFCGQTRLNRSEDGAGEENAITALRTHIISSDGDEHGPRNEYPPGFDPRVLPEHVIEVDGRQW